MPRRRARRDAREEDRYRYRKGWTPAARLAAADRVRAALQDHRGLVVVSEAVAEVVLDVLAAKAVTVTLLDDSGYRDVVNVGDLPPGDVRFPVNLRYPTSNFPKATERLLSRRGYIGSDAPELMAEYQRITGETVTGSIMGVPIIAASEVRGEISATRVVGAPEFDNEDLELARDLATQLGMHLPGLIAES